MEPEVAHKHFKAIKKWKAKQKSPSPRNGAFLLYSEKKMASIKKLNLPEGLVSGRDPASQQVLRVVIRDQDSFSECHNSLQLQVVLETSH